MKKRRITVKKNTGKSLSKTNKPVTKKKTVKNIQDYYVRKARRQFKKSKKAEIADYERYISETDQRDVGEIQYLNERVEKAKNRKFNKDAYIQEVQKQKIMREGKNVSKGDYEQALVSSTYMTAEYQYAYWINLKFPKSQIPTVRAAIAHKLGVNYKSVKMPNILTMRYDRMDQKLHDDKTGFTVWFQYGVDSSEPDAVQWEVN